MPVNKQSSNPGLRLTFLIWPISNSNDVTCATTASEVTTYGRIERCILLLVLLTLKAKVKAWTFKRAAGAEIKAHSKYDSLIGSVMNYSSTVA